MLPYLFLVDSCACLFARYSLYLGTAIVSNKSRANLGGNQLNKTLEDIKKLTEDILTNLTNQSLFNKQVVEFDRKESEKQKRLKRENLMEEPKKLASQLMNSKIMAPIKSLFDWLINFIIFTLLGRTFKKVMDWATDPKNKNKVESIKRFLSDFWPALLATFILFGTGFGKFIRSTVGLIVKMSKFILGKGIPGLIKMFKNLGPKGKVAAAVIVGGIATKQIIGQLYKDRDGQQTDKKTTPSTSRRREQIEKNNKAPKLNVPAKRGGGSIKSLKNNPALSYLNSDNLNTSDLALDDSGLVTKDSGQKVKGAGKDTQLTALQPGEVVISKAAVEHFGGPDYFLKLNQMGGGTNQTKFANNIQLAAGGGLVGGGGSLVVGGNVSNNQNNLIASSNLSNISGGKKFNPAMNLPAINIAMGKLRADEQLSSLTKGSNDYVKPGGSSSVSKTPWSNLKSATPLHAYLDSQKVPTIGWGATFYDSIFSGKKSVKMGDTITKSKADSIFNYQVTDLANNYSNKIKYWPQMTANQRAGLLVAGFNAPNGPIGSYRKLTAALNAGDMVTAAKELQRGGPNQHRINMERGLLLSGPTDLTKAPIQKPATPTQKPKTTTKPKNFIEKIGDGFNKLFNRSSAIPSGTTSTPVLAANKIQKLPSSSPTIGPNNNLNTTTVINLPDVINKQQIGNNKGQGTSVPEFSAVSFAREERLDNVSTYGIA
jgi:GH24 family phage-related lysozyme (muramidase)